MRLIRRRRRKRGFNTFTAGLIGIVAIAVFSYAAYTKFANPFASPFTLHAVFANANGLNPGSVVRIAGVKRRQGDRRQLRAGMHGIHPEQLSSR